MSGAVVRPVVGLATIVAIAAVVFIAGGLFRGSFADTVPVTVLSARAGLVMDPDAKVKMRGVEVGKVSRIESLPNGQAAIHLAMDPSQLHLIPANVLVNIASTTVFGAKFVQLVPPAEPSALKMRPGAVLDAKHVTVEINTVFQQLTSVLSEIEPAKLNETLGAIASALSGRGRKFGQMLSDLDAFLAKLEPALPALSHDLAVSPAVLNSYADAAPDLVKVVDNATRISQTIVDEQKNLDAFLISSIGLADIGNDVIGGNRRALTDVIHLLIPTTDLTNQYHESINCGLGGMPAILSNPPLPEPGVMVITSFQWAGERYRYPTNLPKVAAKSGNYCKELGLPNLPPGFVPPFIITDTGTNPEHYGNQQLLLNSDGLKQLLYGPVAGPPRNVAQVGQPG
ncbi:MCE family protein [Mycobacterium paraffinicum]|uniref:MCE family protein n=1 Tax=Mycobacterium paraffinicum TaxID=53378 RepID=A0ABP8F2Y0_9MYCO|nr:MCE family protein [Mycobacterium paraffinicum]MCV7313502.1 MCE family protein [Mycobacterium paraffinicum]